MGATPNWGISYPDGGVQPNVPLVMQQMAEDVDQVLTAHPNNWNEIQLLNGWEPDLNGLSRPGAFWRLVPGGDVQLALSIDGTNRTSTTFGMLPVTLDHDYAEFVQVAANAIDYLNIYAAGTLTCGAVGTGRRVVTLPLA